MLFITAIFYYIVVKKKLQDDILLFSTGKNDTDAPLKLNTAAFQAAFHVCLYNVSIAIDVYVVDGKANLIIPLKCSIKLWLYRI